MKNSLRYTLSNGVVEGTNNKIKNIKRSGYGYRNFNNLKYRILIIQKQVSKEKELHPLLFEEENVVKSTLLNKKM
ncbi:transposase [Fundicoccus sp. Sow4_H7]|uniref:transposase n=1 Tax=Fundicoccus sp. Sow4_H7 TaxID=3438784 RepID=UPI003F925C60